ncbi:hypothetical protein F5Y15DRAFT_371472 [Xylariaceae sp. FL0016]|nr:hypothetical protein F5Y15DRAFT_371472 [Xylariaceae sp. FL0016]
MRLSNLAVIAVFGTAFAQSNYPNQSAPFNLVLSSTVNTTLNGIKLTACHAGAAVEALCLDTTGAAASAQSYHFNISSDGQTDPNLLEAGLLTWTNTGGSLNYSQSMAFVYNTASNVAYPMFYPDTAQPVAFTTEDLMAVPATVNDAIAPPVPYGTGITYWDNRWAICEAYFQSYTYVALQWVLGNGEAQNPSCQAVTVKRVFV